MQAMDNTTTDPALAARLREAFIYTFPVHDLAQVRWQITQNPQNRNRVPVNGLLHYRRLLDHRARTVTQPNNDTLYSLSYLALHGGPMLLRLPDMGERYYSIALLDIFTNNFACIGNRTTGSEAAEFLLAGPDWSGDAPAGARLIRCPSNDVWLLGRLLVDGEHDLQAVHASQDAIRLEPVGSRVGTRVGSQEGPQDTGGGGLLETVPDEADPARYLDLVNEVLGRNPVPDDERALVASFAEVGIRPGHRHAYGDLPTPIQQAWRALLPALRKELARTPGFGNGSESGPWQSGPDHLGNFGKDYTYRAHVSLIGLGALERAEAIYATCVNDAAGERLDGARAYRLHIPPAMPVDAFWSLSMYEFAPDGRRFFTENPIGRYTIGDRTPGLQVNADGSIDLWLQHARPEPAREANWLPAPAGRFSLTLRYYHPREALLSRRFEQPAPEPIET